MHFQKALFANGGNCKRVWASTIELLCLANLTEQPRHTKPYLKWIQGNAKDRDGNPAISFKF